MVDELIDDPPADGSSFLLDGQTVVIDDYLAVRPERATELHALLRKGALEAGPWFVQGDELIPGGEAFIRNLLAGSRTLKAIGATPPPVMYCPDTFGHPASLPILALGFGCKIVIASRGYGGARWPSGDAAWWLGPDGNRVLFYHLSKSGYETGAHLPPDREAASDRWKDIHDDLIPRSRLGVVLLMNGADHHARQERLPKAIRAIADAASPAEVRGSSLTRFANEAYERATATALPEIRGELRDSYGWMWTLQGTFATRAHQKRMNAVVERILARDVEPWAAINALRGAAERKPLIDAAWRSLLLCHPHDTICGCSTDEVARAMDARLEEAQSQAMGLRGDLLADVIGHVREAARVKREEWIPVAVVRNPSPRSRGGVATLRLTGFLADVKVGIHPDAPPAPASLAGKPALRGIGALQILGRSVEDELTESPRHYPDDDLVAVTEVAAWIPEVPGYGTRSFEHASGGRSRAIPNPARVDDRTLTNGWITARVDDAGRVEFADHVLGRGTDDLLKWESRADVGDEYTPAIRGEKFAPVFEGSRVVYRGPLRAAVDLKWRFGGRTRQITAKVRLAVDANAGFVRISVSGDNNATDHRLRLRIAGDVRSPRVFADSMFGVTERPRLEIPADDARMEYPLQTAPLHRYVSLFGRSRGSTVFSDGLCEYEANEDGSVFVTLLRSVGELSRIDLPERPGNAGWPTRTPGAQCIGPFAAQLAFALHGPRIPAVVDAMERMADDVLLPLTGATLRSALFVPGTTMGIELDGKGLAFGAAKPAEEPGWIVLRCTNLLDEAVTGRWTLGLGLREAFLARLDESRTDRLATDGSSVSFTAAPRAVVTILART
jgi:alpha-mannosidase